MAKKLTFIISLTLLFHLFLSLPHLIWHPGYLYSWFISKNLVIYRDFIHYHLPLATYLIFPFYLAFNWNPEVGPVFSLITASLTLYLLYKISSKYRSQTASTSLLIFPFLFYYSTTAVQYTMEAVAGLLILLLIYRLFYLNSNPKWYHLTNGFLISLTFLTDQITAPTLFFLTLTDLYLIFNATNYQSQYLKQLLIGLIMPITILGLLSISQHGLSDLIYQNVTYYLTYLKLANSKSQTILPWRDILFFYSIPLFSFHLLLTKKMTTKQILLFLGIIASVPTIVFSVFHPHHFLYIIPFIIVYSIITIDLTIKQKNKFTTFCLTILLFLIFYHLSQTIIPWNLSRINFKPKGVVNIISEGDSAYGAVDWIKKYTPPNSTLLVVGDSLVYKYSNRLPSSKIHGFTPWSLKPLEKNKQEIIKNKPDYWLIFYDYQNRLFEKDKWNSPEIVNFINDLITKDYLLVEKTDAWEMWQKR